MLNFYLLMKQEKILMKILSGSKNISFKELVNIQNVAGKAKPYQIKQFLEIIEKNNLKWRYNESLSYKYFL